MSDMNDDPCPVCGETIMFLQRKTGRFLCLKCKHVLYDPKADKPRCDGISISTDGVNWRTFVDPPDK